MLLIFYSIYGALTLMLLWHDVRTGLLPDRFTCPLLWSGILFSLCLAPSQLSEALWGAVMGYGVFAFIYWSYLWFRQREGLGYGDVKLVAALGAWHGWKTLPLLILTASILALIFIGFMALYQRNLQAIKNPLPFGPFLVAAGFIMYGLTWYQSSTFI